MFSIVLLFVAYMQIKNFPLLLGEASITGRVVFFYVLIFGFPVFGIAQALWLRARRPADYTTILDIIEE